MKSSTKNKQSKAEDGKITGNPNIKEFAHLGGMARSGTKNKKTLAKEEAWKSYEQKMIDSLFAITRAQLLMALGSQYLYKIRKEKIGKTIVRKKAERVVDPLEMENYLDEYINGNVDNGPEADYYFFTSSDPDVRAISDILDRLNGKPTQKTELTGKDGERLFDIQKEEKEMINSALSNLQ
jgi:hypothetical protein